MRKVFLAEPAGNTVVFRCKAEGGEPLTAMWFKNGKRILSRDERIGRYKVGCFTSLFVIAIKRFLEAKLCATRRQIARCGKFTARWVSAL